MLPGGPSRAVDVTVPPAAWSDVRGDRHLLKAVLWINRTPFHLEAVEVREDEGGTLDAVADQDRERLDALAELYAAHWATMPITWDGEAQPREYVAFAVPFDE
jgi:hypothetical protein